MSREKNIEIFADTEKLCMTNPILVQAWKKSSAEQKLILEKEIIECEKNRFQNAAEIRVSKKRTFEAAIEYNGKKTVVLNFASAKNPGGGVVNGSSAQEECLCRCSTLYSNLTEEFLWKNFYQPHRRSGSSVHNDDLIYTPEVVVFKSDTACPKLLPEDEWVKVNVITCAAPNLNCWSRSIAGSVSEEKTVSDMELEKIHVRRGRKILEAACAAGNEVVILGAFGCGAFMNKPEVVAGAYLKLAEEFKYAFETIEFAVYCPPQDDSNYRIFKKILI